MNRSTLNRRTFLKSAAALSGAAAFGISQPRAEAEASVIGRIGLRIACPKQFKILQVTDLHFFAGNEPTHAPRNRKTQEILQYLLDETQPDMMIATGDLWPENRDGMGEEYMRQAVAMLESYNIPWAYTWGNHDQLPDFTVGHNTFARAKNSLYAGAQSDGNYVIDVKDKHGRRACQLVCLNTHRKGVQAEERAWLNALKESDTEPVPRLAFFHIPLKQYDTIWKDGVASGFMAESACLEEEDGSTLALLKSMNVKACFCGHDHVNDYSGVIDGVELVYGRATGVGGYGANLLRKGGKLITMNCPKASCDWCSLTPESKKWHPKPGERIDKSDEKK